VAPAIQPLVPCRTTRAVQDPQRVSAVDAVA
jgi:hypothetical protein